ncbi:MAG: efflux RND transporter permease subunit [Myxococcales bacterium]
MASHHQRSEAEHDRELVRTTHNTARYFVQTRSVAWVLLVFTLCWGVYGYLRMPKAKDPIIDVRVAVATCTWPGASAERVEQLVTRKIEQKMSESAKVEKIESISRTSLSVVYITLKDNVVDRAKEFDDIKGRLDSITDLPQGAGPVQFQKDFGDTATLMLTIASPKVNDVELELRARAISHAIDAVRAGPSLKPGQPGLPRATIVTSFPAGINVEPIKRLGQEVQEHYGLLPGISDARRMQGLGFMGLDIATELPDDALLVRLKGYLQDRLSTTELPPDLWRPVVVRATQDTRAVLSTSPGERYTYRELDQFTDLMQRHLQRVQRVSKVTRTGVLPEQVYLDYSQEKIASYGLQGSGLANLFSARNITAPGGILEIAGKNVVIAPSGDFASEKEIGDVLVSTSSNGAPVYLRDIVEISRDYQSPPRFLNYLWLRDQDGKFSRHRAITLAVSMRSGEQIADFATEVNAALREVAKILPEDLIVRRTSDQPLQVAENVGLFMRSLYEAIVLVVFVAIIGFWEWRMALLLALSIPITLAMTFGLMDAFGIDVQQISIASLILALGLLVDDPVVAGDAIKHSLAAGWKSTVAAWLGPTKLATAILFATITNIAAYLPLLTLSGDSGKFVYSLPVVLTLSLVASRLVSMTFIPLLGAVLLRPPKTRPPTIEERRSKGFSKQYWRVVGWAIDHRLIVFGVSVLMLVAGLASARHIKTAFFPKDLSYLSYVDVWLPSDSSLSATREKATEASRVIQEVCEEFGRTHPDEHGKPRQMLESLTEFIGGGGPRFWFSVSPEQQRLNYAQIVIQVSDKEETRFLIPELQRALDQKVPGTRIDTRELENGKAVGMPVAVRVSGEDISKLRAITDQIRAVLRPIPGAARVRDDWGSDTLAVNLDIDPDRANLAGVTNLDVAQASSAAVSGKVVSVIREGDRQIPIVARMRSGERAAVGDLANLYVWAKGGTAKVPLREVSRVSYKSQTEVIRRRNQFRTITIGCFPAAGVLASEIAAKLIPELDRLRANLPPGYAIELGGEAEDQKTSFINLGVILGISICAIYIALVTQFKSALKPLIVFAALPYGAVGALVSLAIMGSSFSFMAFLGIVSLMGVIVSHIIVLFDFIEEEHQRGRPLREALLDAGILRLRPVLITVGATVLGLIPLAKHGGPLWQPLCYAQIGGLTVATFLTLLLVPVIYTIMVRDLKLVRWERPAEGDELGSLDTEDLGTP